MGELGDIPFFKIKRIITFNRELILTTSWGKLVLELVEEVDLHILRYKRFKKSLPRHVLPSRNLTTHTLG
jgi:hypothetical protein